MKLTYSLLSALLLSAPAFADEPAWNTCEFWNSETTTVETLKPIFDREEVQQFTYTFDTAGNPIPLLTAAELSVARVCYEAQLDRFIATDRILCRPDWGPNGEYLGSEDVALEGMAISCIAKALHG